MELVTPAISSPPLFAGAGMREASDAAAAGRPPPEVPGRRQPRLRAAGHRREAHPGRLVLRARRWTRAPTEETPRRRASSASAARRDWRPRSTARRRLHAEVGPLSPAQSFFRAGPSKHAPHDLVIAFVAGELVNPVGRVPQANHRRPRLRPRGGIVDGYGVFDRVGTCSSEALDQTQLVGRTAEVASWRKIGRVDHQRLALHRPRESPCHCRTLDARCGRPSVGITRVSWFASLMSTT